MTTRLRLASAPATLLLLLTASTLLPAPRPAAAAAPTHGLYVGVRTGPTKTHDYSVGGPIANLDDTGFGFEGLLGYKIAPAFAVRVSYVDLGKLTADGPAFGGF